MKNLLFIIFFNISLFSLDIGQNFLVNSVVCNNDEHIVNGKCVANNCLDTQYFDGFNKECACKKGYNLGGVCLNPVADMPCDLYTALKFERVSCPNGVKLIVNGQFLMTKFQKCFQIGEPVDFICKDYPNKQDITPNAPVPIKYTPSPIPIDAQTTETDKALINEFSQSNTAFVGIDETLKNLNNEAIMNNANSQYNSFLLSNNNNNLVDIKNAINSSSNNDVLGSMIGQSYDNTQSTNKILLDGFNGVMNTQHYINSLSKPVDVNVTVSGGGTSPTPDNSKSEGFLSSISSGIDSIKSFFDGNSSVLPDTNSSVDTSKISDELTNAKKNTKDYGFSIVSTGAFHMNNITFEFANKQYVYQMSYLNNLLNNDLDSFYIVMKSIIIFSFALSGIITVFKGV